MAYQKDLKYSPAELGVNALVVTGTPQNSNAFGFDGCNQLTLVGQYTRVAGTNLAFRIEASYDNGSTWNVVQVEQVDTGTGTFDNFVHNDSDSASKNFLLNYTLYGGVGCNLRIGAITCTSGTTDALTLTAIVSRVD